MTRPRIIVLVGPTASGKTALALALAERVPLEIVSADSRQVYRGLDVGTAKPTRAERLRVPHHGIDVVGPDETFDAARFRTLAAAAIAAARTRGRTPIVVGGTGLYVRTLLRGLCAAPPRDPAVREALAAEVATGGAPALHARLRHVDPAAAARIHPHDTVRVARALEVAALTGRPLSAWQAEHAFAAAPYDALVLGLALPTAELDERIAARARAMLCAGFAEEVAGLLAGGLAEDAPAWRTVGYREMRAHVRGRVNPAATLEAIVRATRQFAKRQRTWFRRETAVAWRHPIDDRPRIVDEVLAFLDGGGLPDPADSG